MRSVKFMRAAKTSYIVLSALYCVFGVLLIAVPDFSMKLLGILVGCMMIGFGAVKLMGYFSRDLYRLAFQFDLALGIASLIFGFVMIFRTGYAIEFLAGLIGVFMLIDAVFKIQTAIEANRFGIERWWMILVIALIVAVIGVLLLIQPFRATGVITRLIGLNLCLDGILNLYVVQSTVKTIRRDHDWDI